jgi:hypothetical protein
MIKSYSWDDVIGVLDRELNVGDALVSAAHHIAEGNRGNSDALTRAMYQQKKQVDAACRFFARNRSWPHISPLIAMCVFCRIHRARNAVHFLRGKSRRPFVVPSPKCSVRRMLEYLLIDYWRVYGCYKFPR